MSLLSAPAVRLVIMLRTTHSCSRLKCFVTIILSTPLQMVPVGATMLQEAGFGSKLMSRSCGALCLCWAGGVHASQVCDNLPVSRDQPINQFLLHTCCCLSVSGGGGWFAISSFAAACALMAFATRREAPTGMGAEEGVEVPSVACLVPVVSACCRIAPATREWAPVGMDGTPDAEMVGLGGLVDTG